MLLLAVAALATLVLGAIGIYSVVAYTMAGRAPELGVRGIYAVIREVTHA